MLKMLINDQIFFEQNMAEVDLVSTFSVAGGFVFLAIICGIARAKRGGKPKIPLEAEYA
jgi:hypothetical protein